MHSLQDDEHVKSYVEPTKKLLLLYKELFLGSCMLCRERHRDRMILVAIQSTPKFTFGGFGSIYPTFPSRVLET